MPEPINNLYRRAPVQVSDPSVLYNYGQHPGMSFFERMPVPVGEVPFYDDFSPSGDSGIPSYGDDLYATEQPSLMEAAVPIAGGYLGGQIGTNMGAGMGLGDAVSATFDGIGSSVSGAFQSAGNALSNVFSPAASVATGPPVSLIPTGSVVSGSIGGNAGATALASGAASGTPFVPAGASGLSSSAASGAGASTASGWGSSLFQGGSALGSVGVGLGSALGGIIMGQKPGKAILSGVDSGIGYYLGGPVGGFVGNIVGSVLPGRVVCTELLRQGLIDKALLRAELAHTKAHIPPVTMEGYWVWAVPLVRLMKKSRLATKLIRPIAVWRAEEIGYQMGVRAKPHYRGKAVRLIGESLCWMIGAGLRAARSLNHMIKENRHAQY